MTITGMKLLRKPIQMPLLRGVSMRNASRSATSKSPSTSQARINKVLERVPSFLKPYTNGLRNAPVSHITTFLLLHELTAIVPLIGLSFWFHYTNTLPSLSDSPYIKQGVERFSRYFQRKEWFGLRNTDHINTDEVLEHKEHPEQMSNGSRIVLEVATAYAITKIFMPARLLLSIWATPACARIGLRAMGALGMRSSVIGGTAALAAAVPRGVKSGAAGTGATSGGVVSASKVTP